MEINVSPRTIISSRDKSLAHELDILRVNTDISGNNYLVFQIKTKGERSLGEVNDYFVLQIIHNKNYFLFIPINKDNKIKVSVYEESFNDKNVLLSPALLKKSPDDNFLVKRATNGVEIFLPLEWIDFSGNLGFDAYTVQADILENEIMVNKIYDRAIKDRNRERMFSAITLFNKLCAPKTLTEIR